MTREGCVQCDCVHALKLAVCHTSSNVRAPIRRHARVHDASMAMARTCVAGDRSDVMVCCQITVRSVQNLKIWLCAVPLHALALAQFLRRARGTSLCMATAHTNVHFIE